MIKRTVLLTSGVALLLAAGCNTGAGNPDRPGVPPEAQKGCNVFPQAPKLVQYPVGDRIVGEVRAECDVVPPEHIMEVAIEEELPGGVWSEVENEMHNLFTTCSAVPAPGVPAYCEHVVQCFPGHYRTTVTAYWTDQFGPGVYTAPEKPDARIDCPL